MGNISLQHTLQTHTLCDLIKLKLVLWCVITDSTHYHSNSPCGDVLRRVWLWRRSNPFILIVFFGLPFLTRPRAPLLVCAMVRVCCIIGDDLLPARGNLRRSFLGWRALLLPAPNKLQTWKLDKHRFNEHISCIRPQYMPKIWFHLKLFFTNWTSESILTYNIGETNVLIATWEGEFQIQKWLNIYTDTQQNVYQAEVWFHYCSKTVHQLHKMDEGDGDDNNNNISICLGSLLRPLHGVRVPANAVIGSNQLRYKEGGNAVDMWNVII